jgi:hypothetical protein
VSQNDWKSLGLLRENLGQIGGAVTGYIEKKREEDKLQRRRSAVGSAIASLRAGGSDIPDIDYEGIAGDKPESALDLANSLATKYDVTGGGALVRQGTMGRMPEVVNPRFATPKSTGGETGGLQLSNGRWINGRDEALAAIQDPSSTLDDIKRAKAFYDTSFAAAERIARLTSGLTEDRERKRTQADVARDAQTKADQLGAANTAAGTKEVEITRRITQLTANGEPALKAEKAELMKLREDLRRLQSDRAGQTDEINKLHHILNQADPSRKLPKYDPKTGLPIPGTIAQRMVGNYNVQYLG